MKRSVPMHKQIRRANDDAMDARMAYEQTGEERHFSAYQALQRKATDMLVDHETRIANAMNGWTTR
jgi:hypothetical protein